MNISKIMKNIEESQTLKISAKAKEMGDKVINLSVGEPDFNTPDYIKEAAKKAIDDNLTRYTDVSGIKDLRETVALKFREENNIDCDKDNIIVTNGAKEAIFLALKSIVDKDDEVIIINPYFTSYPQMIKLIDAVAVRVSVENYFDFKIDYELLKKYITDKTKCIIICSPSNPTGIVYSKEELEEISKIAYENNIYVISDEIYEDIFFEGEKFSIGSIDKSKDLVITINGMSKSFAMTGWRVGFACANKDIIKAMKKAKSHISSNTNTISQYASLFALQNKKDHKDIFEKRRSEFEKRRDLIISKISKSDKIDVIRPKGAFYAFIKVDNLFGLSYKDNKIKTDLDVCNLLLDYKKIAVTPGRAFGDNRYIRISYAIDIESLEIAIDRLLEFSNEAK